MIHTIVFLDASGHLALEWDANDPADVERALGDFKTLREAGYTFFRVVSEAVDTFDPSFGRLEVRRVDAAEVEPRVEPLPVEPQPEPPPPGRGRPRKAAPIPPATPERVVAARPMRGG